MKSFDVLQWVSATSTTEPSADVYCATRDIFQARLDSFRLSLERRSEHTNNTSLLVAVVGEIGNNSFDHNLGAWRDVSGVYFSYASEEKLVVCADRGQGLRTTLRKIRPEIQDDQEALRVAFTEKLSGRSPEQRGNGLKFVRSVVGEQRWHLEMRSGDALATVNSALVHVTVDSRLIWNH